MKHRKQAAPVSPAPPLKHVDDVVREKLWPKCKWCHTDLERFVRESGKCPACGAIEFAEPIESADPVPAPRPETLGAEPLSARQMWLDKFGESAQGRVDWTFAYSFAEDFASRLRQELESAHAELDRENAQHLITIDDRDAAQDALQKAHIALGGDGEWVTRLPEPEPPESGDLCKDVPVIAAQIMEEAKRAQESEDRLREQLAAKDEQLEEALECARICVKCGAALKESQEKAGGK